MGADMAGSLKRGCWAQRIDVLLEAVEVEEVAVQAGCQAAELRAVLASALAQPQRKLSNMHSRIHKHLGATAPRLAAEVPASHDTTILKGVTRRAHRMAHVKHFVSRRCTSALLYRLLCIWLWLPQDHLPTCSSAPHGTARHMLKALPQHSQMQCMMLFTSPNLLTE